MTLIMFMQSNSLYYTQNSSFQRRSLHRGHLEQPRFRTDAHQRSSVCEDSSVLCYH